MDNINKIHILTTFVFLRSNIGGNIILVVKLLYVLDTSNDAFSPKIYCRLNFWCKIGGKCVQHDLFITQVLKLGIKSKFKSNIFFKVFEEPI